MKPLLIILCLATACSASAINTSSSGVRLPDGTVVDQPGATVTIVTSTGPTPGGVTSTSTKAKGPGVTAGDASNIKDLNLAVPDVTTGADGEVAAVGGVSGFTFRAVTRSSAGVLYIAGIIAVLAGIAIGALLKRWDWGAYLIAAGGAFIGCAMVAESYPWLPLVIVGLAGLAGVGLLVYRIKTKGVSVADFEKTKNALWAVVNAVSTSPPEAKAAVKAKVAEAEKFDPTIGPTIAAIKAE